MSDKSCPHCGSSNSSSAAGCWSCHKSFSEPVDVSAAGQPTPGKAVPASAATSAEGLHKLTSPEELAKRYSNLDSAANGLTVWAWMLKGSGAVFALGGMFLGNGQAFAIVLSLVAGAVVFVAGILVAAIGEALHALQAIAISTAQTANAAVMTYYQRP